MNRGIYVRMQKYRKWTLYKETRTSWRPRNLQHLERRRVSTSRRVCTTYWIGVVMLANESSSSSVATTILVDGGRVVTLTQLGFSAGGQHTRLST